MFSDFNNLFLYEYKPYKKVCILLAKAVDPEPHGSTFIFSPRSGSRRVNLSTKNRKKCKEIANNCKFIKFFKSKFAQAPLFLTFEQSFMFFTT